MGLSVRVTPRWRGEACSSRTRGESRSFPSGKKTPTGRPHLWAGEDGRAEGERGWAGTRNGPGQCGPRAEGEKGADWAGLAVWAERRKRGRE